MLKEDFWERCEPNEIGSGRDDKTTSLLFGASFKKLSLESPDTVDMSFIISVCNKLQLKKLFNCGDGA